MHLNGNATPEAGTKLYSICSWTTESTKNVNVWNFDNKKEIYIETGFLTEILYACTLLNLTVSQPNVKTYFYKTSGRIKWWNINKE